MTVLEQSLPNARTWTRASVAWAVHMLRYIADWCIILAADLLPEAAALGVVRGVTYLDWALTVKGRIATLEARRTSGRPEADAKRLAREWVGLRYRDLLDIRLIAKGRSKPSAWTVERVNDAEFQSLLDAGQSMMIGLGHFSAAAAGVGFARCFQGASVAMVGSPCPPFSLSGEDLHRRLLWKVGMDVRERLIADGEWLGNDQFFPTGGDVQSEFLALLARPAHVTCIYFDYGWEARNPTRIPFCGQRNWGFALGTTRIARLAQVPVVLIVPERTGPRSVRLHFGPIIHPPAIDDKPADAENMRILAAALEPHVGRIRGQFEWPVGWERRWNPQTEHWETIADGEPSRSTTAG